MSDDKSLVWHHDEPHFETFDNTPGSIWCICECPRCVKEDAQAGDRCTCLNCDCKDWD